jgi:hypothetical protein
MFKKFFSSAAFFVAVFTNLYAQDGSTRAKKFDHYIGVQANQLIKQLINLNASNSTISNPYLLTYAVCFSKNGFGLQGGIGYSYDETEDKLPLTRVTKINELFYRIGLIRKTMISKKWQLGYGMDFISGYQFNKTNSSSVSVIGSQIDSSSSVSANKTTAAGGGIELSLGFHITEKIMLGTEATYYYSNAKVKQNVFATDKITTASFQVTTTESVTNDNLEKNKKTVTFTIPVALFLIIKF